MSGAAHGNSRGAATGRQFPVGLHLAHGEVRCGIAVQRDGPRARSLALGRFAKGRGDVAPGADTKVTRVARTIHRPIQIGPIAAHLHVGLVDAPRSSGRLRGPVPTTLELRSIMVHPTHDRRVHHRQAALGHHLRQIPKAELEPQIPPHAKDDDLAIKVAALEQLVQTQEPRHRAALKYRHLIGGRG